MTDTLKKYWNLRLTEVKNVLEENNFEVFIADNKEDAKNIVLQKILSEVKPKSISWGGSMTFKDTGLYDELKANPKFEDIIESSIEDPRYHVVTDLLDSDV